MLLDHHWLGPRFVDQLAEVMLGLTGRHGLHGPLPDLWSEWSQRSDEVNDLRKCDRYIREFDARGISLEWNWDRSPRGHRQKRLIEQMLESFSPKLRSQQVRRISARRERVCAFGAWAG